MAEPYSEWIATFGLATARLAVLTVLAVWLLTRLAPSARPRFHRLIWSAILLQSLVLWSIPIRLPMLDPLPQRTGGGGDGDWAEGGLRLTDSGGHAVDAVRSPMLPAAGSPVVSAPDWQGMLVGCWILGAATVGVGMLGCWWAIRRLCATSVLARGDWIEELNAVLAAERVSSPVQLRVNRTVGPLLCRGATGYCILVPRREWAACSPVERRAVLRHELAHLDRGDLWKSTFARWVACVHWFNPCAWWAVRRFDEAAEWDCDARLASAGPEYAAALASALLRFSRPPPAVRFAASSARGARVGLRIRRLLEPSHSKESHMKKWCMFAVFGVTVLAGLVRVQLVAQESSPAGGLPHADALAPAIEELAERLAGSNDALAERLGDALRTPAGHGVLRDVLARRAAEKLEAGGGDIITEVLKDHFEMDGRSARLKPESQWLREELLQVGPASRQDLEELRQACRAIAEQIDGEIASELDSEDEIMLLVKRFLSEEYGPMFLYMNGLQEQMQPGPSLLAGSLGRIVVADGEGRLHVRPDAAEEVERLVDAQQDIVRSQRRLAEELATWGTEIAVIDRLHERLRAAATDPLLAAVIVAEQVFEKKRVGGVPVHRIMEQLDEMVVDTAAGLELRPGRAREEVSRVLDDVDSIRSRVEVVRPALAAFREALVLDDPLTAGFAELLETDVALAAVAKATEMAGAPVDRLVRSMISEAFIEDKGRLRLVEDTAVRKKLVESIQRAFREMRAVRRRAIPVRELATRLDDRDLAEALDTIGGVLVVRRLVEQKLDARAAEALEEWRSRTLDESRGKPVIRGAVRPEVEAMLDRIEAMRGEYEDADF